MGILSNRQLGILYYLIANDSYATSEQLADFTGSSIRTIKKEVSVLKERFDDGHCCTIDVSMAKGYFLKVNDNDSFYSFVCTIKSEYGFFKNTNIEKMNRRLYIIQRLLSSGFVKIENLCDELYLTRSSLKDDLVWVKCFLDSYKVKMFSKPNQGIGFIGKEYDLRFVMVETFCSQYHDLKDTLKVERFNHMFFSDGEYYQHIRHSMLKIIRESKYCTKDISTKKLATYLVLTRQRMKMGKFVKFPDKYKSDIESKYEFLLAREIFDIENLFKNSDYPDDELYYFALTLVCFRDVDLTTHNDIKTIDILLVNEAENLYNLIFNDYNRLGKTLVEAEIFARYRLDFVSCIYSIYTINKYDYNDRKKLSTYYEITDFEVSPLAIEMTREVLLNLKRAIDSDFNDVSSNRIILLFDIILKKINFTYHKRNLAVISIAGKLVAREYREIITDRFGRYINYAHVFNQYEMRRIDFNEYDIAIGDTDQIFNNYPISIINSNIFKVEDSTMNIYDAVFRQGYDQSQVQKLVDITGFETEFECRNYKTLFKTIGYRYGSKDANALAQSLIDKELICSHLNFASQIAIVFCDYSFTKSEFVDIYLSSTKMYWNDTQEVKAIIAVSIDPNLDVSSLKVINTIMQVLYNHARYIQELHLDKESTYNEIFNMIITNNFIRQ